MFRGTEIHKKFNEIKATPRLGKMTPFKIAEGVYYVGTYQACCHIIDTGDGLIMIDPGYNNTAYLVINSIYQLGFKPTDIKYIINTHWHGDHTEATADFKDLFGAKTILGVKDVDNAAKYFIPDITVKDGDTLTLGNITIEFMETPGHTAGTISFFFNITQDGKTLRVGSFGGAGANTLVKEKFEFEGCREAYRASLHRLMKEKVDIFIGNHCWNNDTYYKSIKLLETGKNTFVDHTLWNKFLVFCEKRLDEVIAKEN